MSNTSLSNGVYNVGMDSLRELRTKAESILEGPHTAPMDNETRMTPKVIKFGGVDSDSRIRGHCRCDADGGSGARGDVGGKNGGDGQRNDGDGGDWMSRLEQKHTTLRQSLGHIG